MITDIVPDLFRISTFGRDFNLQFNRCAVRDAVSILFDPARMRWIGTSHLQADECGTLVILDGSL